VTDRYALYCGDAVEVLPTLPAASVDLSVYSPPFGGLYNYSSADNDLSNCRTYEQFFEHYEFVVREIERVSRPGRMTAVHCCDVPLGSIKVEAQTVVGREGLLDFPGDIIRLHQRLGFQYFARFAIWKEPLRVAIRTRSKGLMHKQLIKDSTFSNNAGADYLLIFKTAGENLVPVAHPEGLKDYIGERAVPEGYARKYAGWTDQKTNKLSQWIWQQYASSFWDDVRTNRVLPYKAARDSDEEKHVHPLQLDVIERCVIMWSNPGETVLTPFAGVGSEVYGAVVHGRRGIGIELKPSYYRQMVRNLQADYATDAADLFALEPEVEAAP
jgi:DNA modification methylase